MNRSQSFIPRNRPSQADELIFLSSMEYIINRALIGQGSANVMIFAHQEVFSIVISYARQAAICGSVRKTIEQTLAQSNDMGLRAKISSIPTTEGILRAVSVRPSIDTEEELKDFIIKHILSSLRLTEIQREYLKPNS